MGRSSSSIWSSVQVTRMVPPPACCCFARQRLDLGGDLLEQGRDGQHELFARVGEATLRVVRASRRTPSRSSRVRMVWLTDAVMPSLAAALVKLRSRATARKACRSLTCWSGSLLNFSHNYIKIVPANQKSLDASRWCPDF